MTEHPDYATQLSGADQETLNSMEQDAASKSNTWAQARELFWNSNPADGYWDNLSDYSRKKWFDKARVEQTINARVAAVTARANRAEATVRAIHAREDVEESYNDIEGHSRSTVKYFCAVCVDENGRHEPHPCLTILAFEPATPGLCGGCGGSGYGTTLGEIRHEDDSCSDCKGTGVEPEGLLDG